VGLKPNLHIAVTEVPYLLPCDKAATLILDETLGTVVAKTNSKH
jgi:hypothetical protein